MVVHESQELSIRELSTQTVTALGTVQKTSDIEAKAKNADTQKTEVAPGSKKN